MGLFGVGNQVPTIFGGRNAIFGGRPIAAAPAGVVSNWCLSFDGVDDLVTVPNSAAIYGFANITVSLWFYSPTMTTNGPVLMDKDGNTGWYWQYHSSEWSIWIQGGKYGSVGSLTLGEWHHLAFAYDGAYVRTYLDGSLKSTASRTGPISYSTYPLGIGGSPRYGTRYSFNGRIDDVRIYNRALDATEIATLAANTANITTGMTARIAMEEGTGTTTAVTDSTGATIATATLTGGPTWHPQCPPKLIPDRETSVRSLSFDETAGARVDCGTSSALSPLASMRVAFWIKKGTTPPTLWDGVMGRTSTGSWANGWGFFWWTDSQLRFWMNSWSSPVVYCYITDSHWHHVVGEWDGEYIRVYLDGLSMHEVAFAGTQSGLSTTLYLGILAEAQYDFSGFLDDVRIYTALTPAQIRSLARGQSVAGAVVWWKGDETSGTLVTDYGSGGNNGTCVGGVARSTDVPAWLEP